MRISPTITILLILTLVVSGCQHDEKIRRDVLMETVQSFGDVFNTPLNNGKRVYSQYCSVCHGIEGKGDGFNAYNLNPKPRDFSDPGFIARLDSNLVVETIFKGGKGVGLSPLMPSWGRTLKKSDLDDVANFIAYLAKYSGKKN